MPQGAAQLTHPGTITPVSDQGADVGYSGLFGLTGYRYILIAFIARLPLAMSQLGTLMLIVATTGSYALGGLCAGALAVSNAVGAPVLGALTDRRGQSKILVAQCLVGAIAMAAQVYTRYADLHWVTTLLAGCVAGFALPQIGQLARVRWRPLIDHRGGGKHLVGTAFSYEGAADEASFVIGPMLVGIFSGLLGTYAPLLGAALMIAVFGLMFAAHPSARLVPVQGKETPSGSVWTLPFATLIFAQFLVGNLFGSVQTGTTVLTRAAGHPDAAGLFHALLGVGSVAAGIALGRVRRTPNHPKRLALFATAMFVLSLGLLGVSNLWLLAGELFILGFAIAPYMITTFTLAELITDRGRVTTAMTLLAGATGLGYAVGAAVAGRLVTHTDAAPAFAVTVTATTCAIVLAWAAKPLLSRTKFLA